MNIVNRFVAGAVTGAIVTAASGAVLAAFGTVSVNGIVVAAFVGIVSGAASVIGGVM